MLFKKFQMSQSVMEYGIYSNTDIAEMLENHDIHDTRRISEEELGKTDIYFGCVNVKLWKAERCPYYRIYPGVLESLLKLDVDKLLGLDIPSLPFGLRTLAIEIPEDYWDLLDCNAMIIGDYNSHYGVTLQNINGGYGYNLISLSTVKEDIQGCKKGTLDFLRIIFGVLSIGENPDIVKPVVLKADEKKYQLTGDEKYIEKARRRGVIGFEVGEDIPTKAQLRRMIEENELAIQQGRKTPHIRSACLALIGTGKGRSIPRIVKRKSCFVNKDLLLKIPHGFYEE